MDGTDPCRGGLRQGFRAGPDKAFRVAGIGAVQYLLALLDDLLGHAVVQRFRGQQGDAAVAVLAVIPGEKLLAEGARVLDGSEALGKSRPVLEGLELALGVGIVVGDVRSAVGLGHAQVGQQQGDWLGGHRCPAIGMEGQITRNDALFRAGIGDQPPGQLRSLARGHHPADHVAAKNVQDDV